MLSRPAEIDTERKRVSNEPILLVEFPGLGVRYATRDYTWDTGAGTETFTGKLAKGSIPSFSISIPEQLGGMASIGRISLRITDWQASTANELFGTSGDITNETVNLYLKFNTSNNLKSNALLLFTGRVETWKVVKDTVQLDVRPDIDGLKNKLLVQHADSGKYYPIQYGDFSVVGTGFEADYLLRDGEFTPYFAEIIPAVALKENGKTIYLVAGHDVSSLPSRVYYKRDGQFVHLAGATISFSSSAPYTMETFINATVYGQMTRWPTQAASSNQNTSWRNVVDGKSTTLAYVDAGGGTDIAVTNPKFSTVSEAQLKSGGVGGVYFRAVVSFGGIDIDGFRLEISDGVSTTTYAVGIADSNTIKTYDFPTAITDFEAADNMVIRIYYGGSTSSPGDLCAVRDVKILAFVEPPSQNESLFIPMKGKTFQSDWGGRKTVGAVISTAAEIIEDLLRDAGFTEFRTSSFDTVHNDLNALNIKAKCTLKENKDVKELVDDIAKGHFLAVLWSQSGWGLVHRYPSRLAFSYSGDTASPRNEDIFSQTPGFDWATETYSENPLMELSIGRTKKPVDRVVFKFGRAGDDFLYTVETGATSGDTEEIEIIGIGDRTSATNLLNEVKNIYLVQRVIVTFQAFWNSIIFEPGDIINVRHPNLTDSILVGTVNNTKWQILEFRPKFRPNKIQIKAVEVA